MGNFLSAIRLSKSKDTRDLLDSHKAAVDWWSPRFAKAQKCIDYLMGRQWSDEELTAFRQKNKTPVVYNFLKPAERTIIGNFIQSEWDMKWIPVGGKSDEKLVAGLEALRIREAQQQQDHYLDPEVYTLAWASQLAYQNIEIQYGEGQIPRTETSNLNRFSVYPDPTSRDTISRKDAWFIDIVNWYSVDELCAAFPKRAEWIKQQANDFETRNFKNTYEQYNVSTDRGHETNSYRDGLYKVVERYYRVDRKFMSAEEKGPTMSPVTGRPFCPPGIPVLEELYYSVAVEEFGSTEYVFNGRYHCQPIHPLTGKVVWPILEYCFESVNGEPNSGVEFDIDPAKAFNALMSNLLHSAKHASSQALFLDRNAFYSDKDAFDAAKYHADSDRAFFVKDGRTQSAAAPVPHSQSTNDLYSGLEYAKKAQDELTGAPPALQGMREGNQSGILHSQLVNQSETQLAHSRLNYQKFLECKYLLRYIYWRQYYSAEMVVEIVEPNQEQRMSGETSITLNQMVPKKDQYGFEIPGEFDILNDVDAYLYDLSIAPSSRSYSQRMKTQGQLAEISQSPALAADPGLAAIVLEAQLENSDIDPKFKDQIAQRRQQMAQAEQAGQQVAQAETQATQQKAQSAVMSAQAQMTVAQATAQSMQSATQLKGMELQQKGGAEQSKNQVEMAKLEQERQQSGIELQKQQMEMAAQMQQQQFDERMAQADLMMKQMDIKMKELEMQKARREGLDQVFAQSGQGQEGRKDK